MEPVHCDDNKCTGGMIWYEVREYWLSGLLMGRRHFDDEGTLIEEIPLSNGKKHGFFCRFHENGKLDFSKHYVNGKAHGES